MEPPKSRNFPPFRPVETFSSPSSSSTPDVEGKLPIVSQSIPLPESSHIKFEIENLRGTAESLSAQTFDLIPDIANLNKRRNILFLPRGVKTWIKCGICPVGPKGNCRTGIAGELVITNLLDKEVSVNGMLSFSTLNIPISSRQIDPNSTAKIVLDIPANLEPGKVHKLELSLLSECSGEMLISSRSYPICIPKLNPKQDANSKFEWRCNADSNLEVTMSIQREADFTLQIRNLSLEQEFPLTLTVKISSGEEKTLSLIISGKLDTEKCENLTFLFPMTLGDLTKKYIRVCPADNFNELKDRFSKKPLTNFLILLIFAKANLVSGVNCGEIRTIIYQAETFLSGHITSPATNLTLTEFFTKEDNWKLSPMENKMIEFWLIHLVKFEASSSSKNILTI